MNPCSSLWFLLLTCSMACHDIYQVLSKSIDPILSYNRQKYRHPLSLCRETSFSLQNISCCFSELAWMSFPGHFRCWILLLNMGTFRGLFFLRIFFHPSLSPNQRLWNKDLRKTCQARNLSFHIYQLGIRQCPVLVVSRKRPHLNSNLDWLRWWCLNSSPRPSFKASRKSSL